jgi:nucleoside-diphosphate-sugar epimerase
LGNVNSANLGCCYGEDERGAETLFFDYWGQHKVRAKVARIFNAYGRCVCPNDGRVVSNFIVPRTVRFSGNRQFLRFAARLRAAAAGRLNQLH